jgi:hypothetical protein
MRKQYLLLLLTSLALAGCAKTNLLYDENAYNYPQFDKNYYTEWDDIKDLSLSSSITMLFSNLHFSDKDEIVIGGKTIENYTWGGVKDEQFGYKNNLSKAEKKFSYGIISKLFDGRVRCEGLYQKSRVQLDKSGFAMYFPKSLVSTKYLGFACRGGTDFPAGEEFTHDDLNINVSWSFYIHESDESYRKITYNLNNVLIPVDNGGNTAFVNFTPFEGETFVELNGAVAMSFEWSANDPRLADKDLTDNYKENKHHLALMLYEVFIGDSTWY